MDADDMDAPNPYRSPSADERPQDVLCLGIEGRTESELLHRRPLSRLIRLSGRVNAVVEWNAFWPIETVRVNGRVAASQHAFWYCPRFCFRLECCRKGCEVVVEVRTNPFLAGLPFVGRLLDRSAFRLSIDNTVVYLDGQW